MESASGSAGGEPPRTTIGTVILGEDTGREPTVRSILRVVATVVASALALYVIYLLRTPLAWVFFAIFLAVAVSAPINRLSKRMPRGLAILVVYLGVILIPVLIGAILIPPAVNAASDLVTELPSYVAELDETTQNSETLQELNNNFDLTGNLQELAQNASTSLDDAAGALADVGAGLLGSLFAAFTILVLSIFIVGRGDAWTGALLRTRPAHEAVTVRRALDRMAAAVSSYVGGALLQATIAGIAAFVVLSILDVPAPLALAVVVALLDLIPLVGATIGAVIVGLVTLFTDFPTATIVWAVFAIAYQQFENYVVQPRIQSRAVQLDPFVIVVAALFGAALLGVIGALLAIPVAAALQIGVREYLAYKRAAHEEGRLGSGGEQGAEGEDPPSIRSGPVTGT